MTKVLDIQKTLADRKRSRDLLSILGYIEAREKDVLLNPQKYINQAHQEITRLMTLIHEARFIAFRATMPDIVSIGDPRCTPDYFRWREALDKITELLRAP